MAIDEKAGIKHKIVHFTTPHQRFQSSPKKGHWPSQSFWSKQLTDQSKEWKYHTCNSHFLTRLAVHWSHYLVRSRTAKLYSVNFNENIKLVDKLMNNARVKIVSPFSFRNLFDPLCQISVFPAFKLNYRTSKLTSTYPESWYIWK